MLSDPILVGDVGGTNVRFALATHESGAFRLSPIWKRPGRDYDSFESAMSAYVAETGAAPIGASFGFAGPVQNDRVELLHRGWSVSGEALRERLGGVSVVMSNDFAAMARSAPHLAPEHRREIRPGHAARGAPVAVGGPGTGFGMAVVRPAGPAGGWLVIGGEGGHQAYSPQTELEWSVAFRLIEQQGYVSNEMVAAGAGFDMTMDALAWAMKLPTPKHTPAEVFALAESGDPLSMAYCRLCAATVMTAVGDLVLSSAALGGAFIAGGVGVRLERWLKESAATDRFWLRGWREELMQPVPIQLIVHEEAPLIGSAYLFQDMESRGWL